jgi:hypothetical protein
MSVMEEDLKVPVERSKRGGADYEALDRDIEKQRSVALEVCAKPCGRGASLLFHSPFSERKICECGFSQWSCGLLGFLYEHWWICYPVRRGHWKSALGYRVLERSLMTRSFETGL